MAFKARDIALATKAKAAGADYALRIIIEARSAGLPISLAFALVEQESSFKNVYGRDPVQNAAPKGKPVTKKNYQQVYLPERRRGMGNQGVGLTQLTSSEFQDEADRLGGAWKPVNQTRVGFRRLAYLIDKYGTGRGLAAYNAGETGWKNGMRYSEAVRKRAHKWHNVLT